MAKKSDKSAAVVDRRPVHEIVVRDSYGDRAVQQFQVFIPDSRQTVPATVREALEAALEGLTAEGDAIADANAAEAELQATETVEETVDRWAKGSWFINSHPEMDPEDAFCNNWSACLQAMVGVVTVGASRRVDFYSYGQSDETTYKSQWTFLGDVHENYRENVLPGLALYNATVEYLKGKLPKVMREQWNDETSSYELVPTFRQHSNIPEFNDTGETTRTDVLGTLRDAIVDAPTDVIPRLRVVESVETTVETSDNE